MNKLKNTKFFQWFGKGTKTQIFFKKLIAYAVLFAVLYLIGYGCGTLMRISGF